MTHYNEVLAAHRRNADTTPWRNVEEAANTVAVAVHNAEAALENLSEAANQNRVSAANLMEGITAYGSDEVQHGNRQSRQTLINSSYTQVTNSIDRLVEARSRLNNLEAEDIKNGRRSVTNERRTEATREYEDAIQDTTQALVDLMTTQDAVAGEEDRLNAIFARLYQSADPQALAAVRSLFTEIIALSRSFDGTDAQADNIIGRVETFVNTVEGAASTEAFLGDSDSRDRIGNAIQAQFKKATEAVDKYEKALQKVQKYQEALANGENVAGRLIGAMNNLRDAQRDTATLFNEFSAHDQARNVQGYDALATRFGTVNNDASDLLSNRFSLGMKEFGFRDAVQGYETLAKGALNYYKIQQKIANGELLSANELRFLQNAKQYYDEATASAIRFEDHLGVKSDPDFITQLTINRQRFQSSMPSARRAVVDTTMNNIDA